MQKICLVFTSMFLSFGLLGCNNEVHNPEVVTERVEASDFVLEVTTPTVDNILTHDNEKQPKQEYEKEKQVVFSMRSDLFKESESLQMFPIPDKAILVDKMFKYATFNLREKYTLSDIMPLYLQEIEKMGWLKEKHSRLEWTFERG